MGIVFIFFLAVTLFCPVQTKTLTESPSQDPTGAAHPFNVTENVTKVVMTCGPTEFSCDDKHKRCLPMRWRCDGDNDCPNGADEEGCDEDAPVTSKNQTEQNKVVRTCGPTEFSCDDKHKICLPMRWRCDGDNDCPNGADEEGCVVRTCGPTEFSCDDKHKRCLPIRWRCDGYNDCPNGADEEGCVTQDEDAPVTSKNQTEKGR